MDTVTLSFKDLAFNDKLWLQEAFQRFSPVDFGLVAFTEV